MSGALPLVSLLSLLAADPTPARRFALLIGANDSPTGRAQLRYAHRDATGLRDALVRVGSVRPEDAVVLLDPHPAEVLAALERLGATLSQEPRETVLYFYYSGHADDSALYPHGERLGIDEVRRALLSEHATVRLGIIDACSGGGWTRAKGLSAAPPLDLKPLTLASEGTVLIASSSGLEEAHESEALQGSFFTHHLIAGLLGAADASGDGVVTVMEAFQYAQSQTVRASARASLEPQHPSFEWNLRGRRDLVLAQLTSDTSTLSLHQSAGPLQLVELPSGLVLLELPEGERKARLAVAPGSYLVRRIDDRQVANAREVQVVAGRTTSVEESSLELIGRTTLENKGAERERSPEASILPAHTISLELAGGATLGLTTVFGGALRVAWAPTDWLELAFLSPGATVRFGEAHQNEGLAFLGFDSVALNLSLGFVGSARAAGAYRHWFSRATSAFAGAAFVERFATDPLSDDRSGELSAAVTHTFADVFSLNLGVTGSAALSNHPELGIVIGSPRLAGRVLPLLAWQLSPMWTLGLDAQASFQTLHASGLKLFLSISMAW
jgi:hypothetical protein